MSFLMMYSCMSRVRCPKTSSLGKVLFSRNVPPFLRPFSRSYRPMYAGQEQLTKSGLVMR